MHTHRYRRTLSATVAVLCLAGTAGPAAQRPATMTIDFLATGDNGQPVTGLAASDVTLKIGGRDRVVHSVDLVTIGGAPTAPVTATTAASALPPPFAVTGPASAAPAAGRSVLLLIDEGTLFGHEKIVQDAVAQLVASLGPRDRIGLATTRPGGGTVGLTTNHAAVTKALDEMVLGRGNAALCVGALLSQVPFLAQTLPPGRASTLALISRGSGTGNPVLSGSSTLSGAGNCTFRREQLPPVEEAVSATQINYRVLHVGGAGNSANLDNFAGSTGADSAVLSWADASALARAVRESSTFYRATVESPAPGRTDYQRAELRVTRPGVKVRAPQYVTSAPPPVGVIDAASLLRGDAARSDRPIRLTAFASRNAGTLPVKLVVVIEPVEAKPTLLSAIVAVVNAEGEVVGQWTARRPDLERAPLVTAIPVAPGAYRVRAAVTDEAGRGGMAEYAADAVLSSSAGVTLSAMALGVSASGAFTPRLLFTSEPEATAYLELYDVPAGAAVAATFELAAAPGGPATASVSGTVIPGNGVHMVTATLPLTSLQAGDTLVRAVVRVNGADVGTVVRTLRRQ
jgi:hypothetical protein